MTECSEIKGGFAPLKRFALTGILYALDCFVAPSPRLITIDEKTVVSSAHRGEGRGNVQKYLWNLSLLN